MLINNVIYNICIQVFMCMEIIVSNQYLGMVMNDMLECKHSGSTPWHAVSINNESHYLSLFDPYSGVNCIHVY